MGVQYMPEQNFARAHNRGAPTHDRPQRQVGQGMAVFICHSSQDLPDAMRILQIIEDKGHRCWIAPRDAQAGENYAAQIVAAIRQSSLMLSAIDG